MAKPLDPRLLHYARGVRTLLIGSVAVASGTAVLVVAQAFCLGYVVSRVFLDGASLDDVRSVLVVLALVVLGRALLATVGETLSQRAATRTSAQLRDARHRLGRALRRALPSLARDRRDRAADRRRRDPHPGLRGGADRRGDRTADPGVHGAHRHVHAVGDGEAVDDARRAVR